MTLLELCMKDAVTAMELRADLEKELSEARDILYDSEYQAECSMAECRIERIERELRALPK